MEKYNLFFIYTEFFKLINRSYLGQNPNTITVYNVFILTDKGIILNASNNLAYLESLLTNV